MSAILKVLIILLTPLILIMGSIRLLTTNAYLGLEYGKPDFPPDSFGFTPLERLDFASANLHFVSGKEDLGVLTNQEYAGQPLYNERELSHMQDVQNVFQGAWFAWKLALGVAALSALYLILRAKSLRPIGTAFTVGGLLTAGAVLLIGFLAIVGWDSWFTSFHELFFIPGTWTFNYSDTLIRLFPEKFWFDGALTVSALSLVSGLVLAWIGGRFELHALHIFHTVTD